MSGKPRAHNVPDEYGDGEKKKKKMNEIRPCGRSTAMYYNINTGLDNIIIFVSRRSVRSRAPPAAAAAAGGGTRRSVTYARTPPAGRGTDDIGGYKTENFCEIKLIIPKCNLITAQSAVARTVRVLNICACPRILFAADYRADKTCAAILRRHNAVLNFILVHSRRADNLSPGILIDFCRVFYT